ncbi:MAG: MogA/MoaB family molybdenum cofactor biosynthesis protein [Polyangiaceae bacterium]|nr:MogA/MoaB family molybdenum cofactor biosynthesis protein [Polyangiaceae bacterium]
MSVRSVQTERFGASPPPRVITVTVSDTRSAQSDASGRALIEELAAFTLVRHVIVPDDPARIAALVEDAVEHNEADAIVFSGGTGISARDQTVEALERLFDKKLDGFGEAFRCLSWDEVGPRAILSRATAGTVGSCLVFSLPGSEKAARLGARALIAPILGHAVNIAHGRTAH